MAHEVKNTALVDYHSMNGIERREHGFEDLYREWSCTEFYADDDNYDLYMNVDDEDNHDMRKYAVYQRSTGELKCLLGDAAMALDLCYDDNDFRDKRHEMYRQIALAAGWPEKMNNKKRYTVHIVKTFDIEVRADNSEQARDIGMVVAWCANDGTIHSDALEAVNEALESAYFDVDDVYPAENEDSGYWDMSLSESECNKILKEG